MNGMKWIKIATDIFEDEKIFLIESSSKSDTYIVIWFKLLCLAGKQNNTGVLMMNDKLPYTSEMLATIFRRSRATVEKALKTFENYGMIELVDGVITIPNWEKHQSADMLAKKKERDREYQKSRRERQAMIAKKSSDVRRLSDENRLLEKEGDKEREKEKRKRKDDCERLVESYHSFCPSLPPVKSMTEKRKEKIGRLLELYSIEQIEDLFRIAEKSRFLTGGNNRHWTASFDWLMDEEHFVKVLEGNYSDSRETSKDGAEKSYDLDDFFEAAVRKGSGNT